jgi:hypothetical protein
MHKVFQLFAFIAVLGGASSPLAAAVLFSETFNTNGGPASYPLMSFSNGNWYASGGELHANAGGPASPIAMAVATIPATWAAQVTVEGDLMGSTDVPGSYNVGLVFGNAQILIHPDYPGGAFRLESPPGANGSVTTNIDMGFTPSAALWQHATAVLTPNIVAGQLSSTSLAVTLVEPATSNSFNFNYLLSPSMFNPSAPFAAGFSTVSGSATTSFDNLLVTAPVPEPVTILIWLGVVTGLVAVARPT